MGLGDTEMPGLKNLSSVIGCMVYETAFSSSRSSKQQQQLQEDEPGGEPFSKDKLHDFLQELSYGLDVKYLKLEELTKIITGLLPSKIYVYDLLDLVSETLASRVTHHYDHSILAGRVTAKKIQKLVGKNKTFSENVLNLIRNLRNPKSGKLLNFLSSSFLEVVEKNASYIDLLICHTRDYELTYFGIKTLEKLYLLKEDGLGMRKYSNGYNGVKIVETPQFMFLRVAIGIHGDDLFSVKETYDLMSQKYFIHASPTLYNAGGEFNYLSSCFLVAMEDDSIDGIFKTLHKTALVSKASGGIGLHVHNIRGTGSYISSSNGTSSGLIPMLKVFNDTARYVDQGGNKRPGAFAIYLEPWHSDIFDLLNLKKNHGKEELRTRDLFFGLWIPDLFMQRVKENGTWSLFSPDESPGLSEVYGEEFNDLYTKYELEDRSVSVIKAQKLWLAILELQTETGGPYMLYKDACNLKSNQNNLGVIKSSNLCCEIVEYSSQDETAVCNLGSLALPSFIKKSNNEETVSINFKKLHKITKILAKNLNKIIDVTKYPIESAEKSNKRHRPIAIGVQGLADLFLELRLPFDSQDAKLVNIQIFETIYHAAIETSIELAKADGPYETFNGSPASKGLLQFDLWDNHKPSSLYDDWDELKKSMITHGLRNSLLVAPMPTASTSQILGFNECFEPYTSNIYSRRVLSGEFQIVNKYLLKDLIELGIWSGAIKDKIILDNGSIQHIEGIPKEIKDLYKTVWEISQRTIIDMAVDRGKFIDQLQSMNIHMRNPTMGQLTSCHFYGWEKGLKTGMYYLRTQAAARAIQFTLDHDEIEKLRVDGHTPILKRSRYEMVKGNSKPDLEEDEEEEDVNIKKPKPSLMTPSSQVSIDDEESYNIHDSTPLACDITDQGACESCSG